MGHATRKIDAISMPRKRTRTKSRLQQPVLPGRLPLRQGRGVGGYIYIYIYIYIDIYLIKPYLYINIYIYQGEVRNRSLAFSPFWWLCAGIGMRPTACSAATVGFTKQKWCRLRLLIYHMGVSKNSGIPKSSILIGFSLINHPFWGTTIFGSIHNMRKDFLHEKLGRKDVVARFCIGLDFVAGFWIEKVLFEMCHSF